MKKNFKSMKNFALMGATVIVAGLLASSIDVKAEEAQKGTIYYDFSEVNDISGFNNGQKFLFLKNKYASQEAVVDLPNGSAELEFCGTDAETIDNHFGGGMYYADNTKMAQGAVEVVRRGSGFDTCSAGTIARVTSSEIKASVDAGYSRWYPLQDIDNPSCWRYGCNGGGVAYVGPFYAFSYKQAEFTEDNLSVYMKNGYGIPEKSTAVTPNEVVVRITLDGKVYEVPYFTIDESNNTLGAAENDYTIAVKVGNVYKTVEVQVARAQQKIVAKPDMNTVNISGLTLNSWYDITKNLPKLTNLALVEVSGDNSNILHVNIVGKADKIVPSEVIATLKNSNVSGLHVFIGESDAVTFLNNIDYDNYKGVDFSHVDVIENGSRTIDFLNKTSINADVVFHTLIAPNANATIYKVVDGAEVEVGKAVSNSDGRICFKISETAKYIIKY